MATVKDFKAIDFERAGMHLYDCEMPHVEFFKKDFVPAVRREFKTLAKKIGAELVAFNPGYFEISAFFQKDGNFMYVNLGDVRYNSDWYDNVLYRTANSEKDYKGGANCYCSYKKLGTELFA